MVKIKVDVCDNMVKIKVGGWVCDNLIYFFWKYEKSNEIMYLTKNKENFNLT